MKKFLICLCMLFIVTGCSYQNKSMEKVKVYTTDYPSEYITKRLYKKYGNVKSIYPNGVNPKTYVLTNKQISDYSKGSIYIFNGLNNTESSYIDKFRSKNKDLKIIDSTLSMEYGSDEEELWLDPSNFLMMAKNIKTGLNEYTTNYYINEDINNNYEDLKIDASNLEAKMTDTVDNSSSKVILASDKLFKYLEKYGLKVYVIDSDTTYRDLSEIKKLINNGEIKHIFTKENDNVNSEATKYMKEYGLERISWHTLSNLTEEERTNKETYFDIMNDNIEMLKNEIYS